MPDLLLTKVLVVIWGATCPPLLSSPATCVFLGCSTEPRWGGALPSSVSVPGTPEMVRAHIYLLLLEPARVVSFRALGADWVLQFPQPFPVLCRCQRRCERTSALAPQGYPVVGYYCHLHEYQKPKDGEVLPEYAEFLKKCPSYETLKGGR